MSEDTPKASRDDDTTQVIRRKDIKALADSFSNAMKPLGRTIELMQAQNLLLRRVVIGMIIISITAVAGIVLHFVGINRTYVTSSSIGSSVERLTAIEKELAIVITDLRSVKATAKSMGEDVAAVKAADEAKPQLEFVPETDPVRALRAPVKLRVTLPKDTGAPDAVAVPSTSATPVAEIPIPTESF